MIRTRFAPSPTGYLHIGGVRTALFSWLYARHHGGRFILRIEDTDRERSTPEAVQVILEGLEWLGLNWDEGPVYQSQRSDRYGAVIEELLQRGHAYRCYCSREELEAMREAARVRGDKPRYNGKCRARKGPPPAGVEPVIRFATPLEGEVVVDDLIQGRVVYRNSELDDLILARADGSATYNLTVVVDDLDMEVTDVIRGDDHLNNAARQVNIFQALERTPPRYAHIPLILGPDGRKLSKRHGTVSVLQYRDDGYLPEALINYLVRLGWSHGDQEIFSRDEMVDLFDVTDVNKAAAALNPDKLLWLNQHYLKDADPARLATLLRDQLEKIGIQPGGESGLEELAAVQRERCRTVLDMAQESRIFFEDFEDFDNKAARKYLTEGVRGALEALRVRFADLDCWEREALHEQVEQAAQEAGLKLGKVAQPLRVAVTGGPVSPAIDVTLKLLGRERSLRGIERALRFIDSRAAA